MRSAVEDDSVGFDSQILHQRAAAGEDSGDASVTNGE
jgi:hypothetical protein